MLSFNPKLIYLRLYYLRKSLGHSQQNFAELLGITYRTYQRIEAGETSLSIEQIFRISKTLDIPASVLMSENYCEWVPEKILDKERTTLQSDIKLSLYQFMPKNEILRELEKIYFSLKTNKKLKYISYSEGSLAHSYLSKAFQSNFECDDDKLVFADTFQDNSVSSRFWEGISNRICFISREKLDL